MDCGYPRHRNNITLGYIHGSDNGYVHSFIAEAIKTEGICFRCGETGPSHQGQEIKERKQQTLKMQPIKQRECCCGFGSMLTLSVLKLHANTACETLRTLPLAGSN